MSHKSRGGYNDSDASGGKRMLGSCHAAAPNFQMHIDDFFAAVQPVEAAYRHPTFNFVAVRYQEKFGIVQAAVLLNISPSAELAKPFESANVRAGRYELSELNLDLKGMIDPLYSGVITTPADELHFLKPAGLGARSDNGVMANRPDGRAEPAGCLIATARLHFLQDSWNVNRSDLRDALVFECRHSHVQQSFLF